LRACALLLVAQLQLWPVVAVRWSLVLTADWFLVVGLFWEKNIVGFAHETILKMTDASG
jgi:hypothetical protein